MKDIFSRQLLFFSRRRVSIRVANICILFLILSTFACNNSKDTPNDSSYASLLNNSNSTAQTTHRWFYFTENGFKETDIPRNAPDITRNPWTQSIRVTSSLQINDMAYLGVNKLGIIEVPHTYGFQENGIASTLKLITNPTFFSKGILGEIFNIETTPVLSFYTNSFFTDTDTDKNLLNQNSPFLVSFDTNSYEFSPLLSQNGVESLVQFEAELTPDKNIYTKSEIRGVYYDAPIWTVLFKSNLSSRTDFFALSFTTDTPLTTNTNQTLQAKTQTMSDYREITRPKPSTELPRRLKDLLSPIAEEVSYYVSFSQNNEASSEHFEHISTSSKAIQGYALALDHCSLAIFEDGTIVFAGSLLAKEVLNDGNPLAFTLPDLGPGYLYGPMVLSGSTLIISWEETSFFETAKSGFLAVDMEQVLYQSTIGD